MNIISGSQFRR